MYLIIIIYIFMVCVIYIFFIFCEIMHYAYSIEKTNETRISVID